MRSIIGNVELDVDCASRICGGILSGTSRTRAQFKALFGAFPEITRRDVHQQMMLAICRQWCQFDPGQAQPQTFFFQRGSSAMLDYHRSCKSKRRTLRGALTRAKEEDFWHHDELAPIEQREHDDELEAAPEPAAIGELLAGNLLLARKLFGARRYRRGRKLYSLPQLIAIAMLMRRLKIGSDRCRKMLVAREDLREAIKLKSVPSDMTLDRAAARLTGLQKQLTPSVASAPAQQNTRRRESLTPAA